MATDSIDEILSNRRGNEAWQGTLASIAGALQAIPQIRARREAQQAENEYRMGRLQLQQGEQAIKQRAMQMDQQVNQIVKEAMVDGPDGTKIIDRRRLVNGFAQSGIPIEKQQAVVKSLDDVDASLSNFAKAKREHTADVLNAVLENGATPDAAMLGIAYGKANGWLSDNEIEPLYRMLASDQDIAPTVKQLRDSLTDRYKNKGEDETVVVSPGGTLMRKKTGEALYTAPMKDPAAPHVGSFEDYAIRYAQAKGKKPEELTPADVEDARKRYQQADDRPPRITVNTGNLDDVKETVRGMKDGTLPPQLPGRATKEYNAIMAEAHRQGFDLARAATDWQATQKHVATLNGAQQTRMAQAIDNASHSLDVIEDLAKQWDGGKFPLLNKAQLSLAKQGALGAKAQQIATKLEAQIADVTSELANVYMGGNSPTDHALTLAAKNLSADWTRDQLRSALELSRKNLQIRSNSMKNVGVAGASPANPYAPPRPPSAPSVGERRMINGQLGEWDGKGWKAVK